MAEKILKRVTPSLLVQAKEILSKINPKWATNKKLSYIKQAYELFGINIIHTAQSKHLTLTLNHYADMHSKRNHSMCTGFTMQIKPINYALDVEDVVISYRLHYKSYYMMHNKGYGKEMLDLMED